MLKPILLGSAMLLALPALAQTTNGTQSSGTATTTNDHDPTMEEDDATAEGAATVGTQANGGVRSSQTTTATDADAQGTTGTMNHGTMNHGTMNHGTAAQAGTAQGTTGHGNMNHGTMNHGAAGQAGTTGQSGMNHGTMNPGTGTQGSAAGGTMSGGTAGGGTMSGWSGGTGNASGAYTGVGGPMQGARDYPPCSRTVTDSCIQLHERGRRR